MEDNRIKKTKELCKKLEAIDKAFKTHFGQYTQSVLTFAEYGEEGKGGPIPYSEWCIYAEIFRNLKCELGRELETRRELYEKEMEELWKQ